MNLGDVTPSAEEAGVDLSFFFSAGSFSAEEKFARATGLRQVEHVTNEVCLRELSRKGMH